MPRDRKPRNGATALFETPVGAIGFGWTEAGIDRVQLPGADRDDTARRLAAACPGRPLTTRMPAAVRGAARRLTRHLGGRPDPLRDVAVDLSAASPFARQAYEALRRVTPGSTVTYAELARRIGRPGAARAMGRAMGANPVPLLVPCHRVLAADNALGGFSSPRGVTMKARLLFLEGVVPDPEHAAGIAHLRRVDPKLREVIDRVGPYCPSYGDPADAWGSLVEAIVFQQISIKAAATIAGRLRALTPGPAYPRAEELMRLTDARLRKAGISRQKIGYLRDLALATGDGRLSLRGLARLGDATVEEQITRVRGLGRWSAHMYLLFHLGRLDILPVDDLGFREGVKQLWGLSERPDAAALTRRAEPWRPYRSMGTWYVWASRREGES